VSRRHLTVAALGALFLMAGLTAHAQDAPTPRPTDFPRYPSIEPNIRFWVRVYSEWGLGQVVIHDMERPELIYEVVALPGTIQESYSDEQRELIRTRVEGWRDKLRTLEVAIAAGQELSDEQKALALLVTTNAGSEAIRGACDRVRMQRGVRERFRRGLEISQRYDALIRQTLREEGVPETLAYLPHVESSFQSRAVSSAGAVGAWQFTRSAGRRFLHVTSAFDERLDAVLAARGAARYLKDAYAKLGQWPLALTSYNHGVGGMTQAVAQLGQDYEKIFLEYDGRLFGFASRNFYPEFLAAVEVASQPATFFPDGLSPEPPLDYDRTTLTRASSPRVIARQHGLSVEELAALNPAWTARALRSGLSIPANATVWLPRGTLAQRGPA
jgi:peptidoglycan lytic transglycosylase D